MKKLLKSLVFISLLSLLWTSAVLADSYDVTFDGKKVNIATDSQTFSNIQPGVTQEIELSFANLSSNKTNWYITNEVLQSLEDDSSAANGAYTYTLKYIDPTGSETTLYTNETVGGDALSNMKEGLHQITQQTDDNTQKYFYVGSLEANQAGTIAMTIGFDGESQPNSYQDTIAKLQLTFAVEEELPNQVVRYYIPNTSSGRGLISNTNSIYVYGFVFSALGLLASLTTLLVYKKKGGK